MDDAPIAERFEALEAQMGDVETALDSIIEQQEAIIAMQNILIGGDGV